MKRWPFLALTMLPLLAGCARFRAEPLSASASAAALEARSLSDPRLRAFIDAASKVQGTREPAAWTLRTLTLAALYFHPDLDIARSRLAFARAHVRTAAQSPNPSLNLTPEYFFNYSRLVSDTPWVISGMVNFIIETFDKRPIRTEQARYLADAARDDLASAGWQVRSRVRAALLDLWIARQQHRMAAWRRKLQAELVSLLAQRFAAGEASALDVSRERLALDQTVLAINQTDATITDARARLATAIGVPAHALEGVKIGLAAFDRTSPSARDFPSRAERRRALAERADVQSAVASYAAAQSALRLEVANQYPNVQIGPGYGSFQGDNAISLSLTADLPILNQNQGQIAEAVARRNEAAANVMAVQAKILGAIDQAAAAYRAAARTEATAGRLVAEQERRVHDAETQFRAGATDRPALVTAETELALTRQSRLDAVAARARAEGALEDALEQNIFDPNAPAPAVEASPRAARAPEHKA